MKFARFVFAIAGALGVVASIGLYFTPGSFVYYGLIAAIWAWQVAFFMIAWDPRRFRPIMIPSIIEKLVWVVTLTVLHLRGEATAAELARNAIPHGLLGVLFVIAFFRTPH